MSLLDSVVVRADLRRLTASGLAGLAGEIRRFLIRSVCRASGHRGPNLGVVELTIAVHPVFDSPTVPIVLDTGQQAYMPKMLPGRRDGMPRPRARGGLSGCPNRSDSVHELVENDHLPDLAVLSGARRVS